MRPAYAAVALLALALAGPAALAAGEHRDHEHRDHDHGDHHDHGAAGHQPHWTAPAEAAARPNPVPAGEASVERGARLFATYCASCHGAAGRGDGPAAASMSPRPANLAVMAPRHSDGDLAWKIANGRGPMPAWQHVLGEDPIWDLVNYLKSLGGGG